MKIAMTSLYLPGGSKIGVGYQVHHMANQMVLRGHEVTVFSQCPAGEDALYDLRQIMSRARIKTFGFAWDLRKVDFSAFDVLHAHGDDWFLWGIKRPRHIHTFHGSCLAESRHQARFKERLRMLGLALCEFGSLRLCDETVGVSEGTQRLMPRIRHVIPNGVEVSQFCPGQSKSSHPAILFVGTLKGRKRGALLLRIFQEEIRPKIPDAVLWAVCEEPIDAPGVHWFGRVPMGLLTELYRKAWVFCLPSTYEGFGIPYIEAMASGTAVVATPNSGAIEVLGHGTCGVLAAEPKLGKAILQILSNNEARRFFENAGLQRAQSFCWERICSAYEALYTGRRHSGVLVAQGCGGSR